MKNLYLLFILIILGSCSTVKLVKSNDVALILVTASTSYVGGSGNGMLITIENIDTGDKYESKKLSNFSSHSVIQNVEPGKYRVQQITLNTGNNKFSNWSENIQEYFGVFELEGGSKYYLGNYKGKVKLKFKNAISIKLQDYQIPESLNKFLAKQNSGWELGDFNLIKTVSKEEIIIY